MSKKYLKRSFAFWTDRWSWIVICHSIYNPVLMEIWAGTEVATTAVVAVVTCRVPRATAVTSLLLSAARAARAARARRNDDSLLEKFQKKKKRRQRQNARTERYARTKPWISERLLPRNRPRKIKKEVAISYCHLLNVDSSSKTKHFFFTKRFFLLYETRMGH